MPVTKTAKRALRSSHQKFIVNKLIENKLEKALRTAKKSKLAKDIKLGISLADKAAKKHTIHKNKANRLKGILAKLKKDKK